MKSYLQVTNFSASIILYLDSLLSGHLTESFNIRKSAIKALKHGLELHFYFYVYEMYHIKSQ